MVGCHQDRTLMLLWPMKMPKSSNQSMTRRLPVDSRQYTVNVVNRTINVVKNPINVVNKTVNAITRP